MKTTTICPAGIETTPATLNGVATDKVGVLLGRIAENCNHAKAGFRVTTRWHGGVRSRSHVDSWSLGGGMLPKAHLIDIDEPVELGGTDTAPNPQEALLAAFNACVMATYVAICTMKGIAVRSIEIESHGELDLHGFLALDDTTDPGYHDLHYRVTFAADAPEDALREIHEAVKRQSPNFFNMARSIRLHDTLVTA